MEAFRKLRDQVARQQQAVLKQFGGGAFGSFENISLDEAELRQHHKIEKLYTSTRSCKHFQRDVVRGLEGYIVTGSKQVEIGNKMAEDSKKYGTENTCTSSNTLTKAAFSFSRARTQMAKEQEHLLRVYGTQVSGTGWAEGECRGKAGWFPLGHIERRERVLASKISKV